MTEPTGLERALRADAEVFKGGVAKRMTQAADALAAIEQQRSVAVIGWQQVSADNERQYVTMQRVAGEMTALADGALGRASRETLREWARILTGER